MGEPGVAARSSEHFASEFGSGLSVQAAARAGRRPRRRRTTSCRPRRRSSPGLVPLRRALTRLARTARSACPAPARPCGRSILRSTTRELAADVRPGGHRGRRSCRAPGDGAPFVAATTIRTTDRREEDRMTRQAISTDGRAGRRSGRTARRSGAATSCSARASSGSIPATGELADGVEAQAERALRNLAVGARRGRAQLRRRREDDDLPRRHRRLRGGQRGLREVHARSAAGPLDVRRRRRCRRAAWSRSRRSPAASRSTPSPARRMDARRRAALVAQYEAGRHGAARRRSRAWPTRTSIAVRPTAAGRRARSSTTSPTAR